MQGGRTQTRPRLFSVLSSPAFYPRIGRTRSMKPLCWREVSQGWLGLVCVRWPRQQEQSECDKAISKFLCITQFPVAGFSEEGVSFVWVGGGCVSLHENTKPSRLRGRRRLAAGLHLCLIHLSLPHPRAISLSVTPLSSNKSPTHNSRNGEGKTERIA